MNVKRIARTYIWHENNCWFVSTDERDSSHPYGSRYTETMVWERNWDQVGDGELVYQSSGAAGSVANHNAVVECFFRTGKPPEE